MAVTPGRDRRPHTFDRDTAARLIDMARRDRGALTDPPADPQVPSWENSDVRFCLTPPGGIPAAATDQYGKPKQFFGATCEIFFGDYTPNQSIRNAVQGDSEIVFNVRRCPIPENTLLPCWRSNDGTIFTHLDQQRIEVRWFRAITCARSGPSRYSVAR